MTWNNSYALPWLISMFQPWKTSVPKNPKYTSSPLWSCIVNSVFETPTLPRGQVHDLKWESLLHHEASLTNHCICANAVCIGVEVNVIRFWMQDLTRLIGGNTIVVTHWCNGSCFFCQILLWQQLFKIRRDWSNYLFGYSMARAGKGSVQSVTANSRTIHCAKIRTPNSITNSSRTENIL